jgi:hypothetical protein
MAVLVIALITYLFKVALSTGGEVVDAIDPSKPILLDDAAPPY